MQCVFHDVHAISIHALREESDRQMRKSSTSCGISIHALREESDPQGMGGTTSHRHFNPRSP